MIDPAAAYRTRDDIRYRIIDNEAIVVQQSDGRVMNLNPVGTRILTALDGVTPVEQLIDTLAALYDVAPARFAADALGYLEALQAAHVIEPTGGSGDHVL